MRLDSLNFLFRRRSLTPLPRFSVIIYFFIFLPLQEAIETFKEALKLKSDFIDAYKSLGQAYRYCLNGSTLKEFMWLYSLCVCVYILIYIYTSPISCIPLLSAFPSPLQRAWGL